MGDKPFPDSNNKPVHRNICIVGRNELTTATCSTTCVQCICNVSHGPLARYVQLRGAHAPGMPGTFSLLPQVSDHDMHHGTCVTHVPWCKPRSLTSGFLWIRWRIKRSRHSRRMRNPQFYVSGKRPMVGLMANTYIAWSWLSQPQLKKCLPCGTNA